ncbi:MAG: dihydroneopterin aldolase [Crocinitomicaceae bacterium]|nr:dihydroneopterin aldolase [Crocinitomicaceae bacterium]MDG1734577.1 dihydroneopterin aldolase [Crocinitomicaceae bacterium]MDG2505931.1 dihydroneopterin aldolase [Crocinitomicaceae bacterium]
MKHSINVEDIKLYAYHGCMEEEGLIGGHYSVDVLIETDFSSAAEKDDLNQTVDYVWVNQIVKEEMAIRSKLIETVGQRIINRLKETATNSEFKVVIKKLRPPIDGDVTLVSIGIDSRD